MEVVNIVLRGVDPILIEPYRWLGESPWAWWLGTLLLCMWAFLVGDITYRIVSRFNRKFVNERNQEMLAWHKRALNALKAGNKEVYTGANKLANEAFGHAFFLQAAMGMASLWPAFLGAAWLQARFSGVPVPVPFGDLALNWLPPYVVMYIIVRLGMGRLMKLLLNFELYKVNDASGSIHPPQAESTPGGGEQNR